MSESKRPKQYWDRKEKSIQNCIDNAPAEFRDHLYEFWLEIKEIYTPRGKYSINSQYNALSMVRLFLKEHVTDFNRDFTRQKILRFLEPRKKRRNYITSLKRFSDYLNRRGLVSDEENEQIQSITTKDRVDHVVPGTEKKYIIPQKRWNEILKHTVTKKYNGRVMACWLGLNFGLRVGEIVNLKLEDLFLEAEDPFFMVQPHPDDNYHPKTLNSVRRLYVTETQAKMFERYLQYREQYLEAEKKRHGYLIYDFRGDPYVAPGSIGEWMREITLEFEEHGKKVQRRLRPHVLRYSSAWFYYNKTKNLYAVSKFLGHSSVSETETYLGLTEEQRFREIQKMMEDAWDY